MYLINHEPQTHPYSPVGIFTLPLIAATIMAMFLKYRPARFCD